MNVGWSGSRKVVYYSSTKFENTLAVYGVGAARLSFTDPVFHECNFLGGAVGGGK